MISSTLSYLPVIVDGLLQGVCTSPIIPAMPQTGTKMLYERYNLIGKELSTVILWAW